MGIRGAICKEVYTTEQLQGRCQYGLTAKRQSHHLNSDNAAQMCHAKFRMSHCWHIQNATGTVKIGIGGWHDCCGRVGCCGRFGKLKEAEPVVNEAEGGSV